MEGRNEGAGINPNSCWDSWNTDFSGKDLFGTWMSLNTTASSELYALLIPEISTEGIHRFYVDFLQPDSASQSPDYKANILSSSNISPEQGCSSRTQPDQSMSQFKMSFRDFSKRRGFVLYIKYSVAGYYLLAQWDNPVRCSLCFVMCLL